MPPPPSALHALFRKLRLGRLLYLVWHVPTSALRASLREGGPWVRRRVRAGMAAMECSVSELQPLAPPHSEAPLLRPHLLTGARFWYQTAYCLQSLGAHAQRRIEPVIHDDGTLRREQIDGLRRLFPAAQIITQREFLPLLEDLLPAARYPVLRERWKAYPHIRKLIDVHLGGNGWKLVLDSDLLFFRRPELLLSWSDAADRPLCATDCTENYGYDRALMQRLCGHPIGHKINVGLCGLRSEDIDWEKLEHWTAALIREGSTSYYLEQALTAMLLAGRPFTQAPADDYLTLPAREEALAPTAVMHHYVDLSKRWYFTRCWQLALMGREPPPAQHTSMQQGGRRP